MGIRGKSACLAACLCVLGTGAACRAQGESTIYLTVETGVFSDNGARYWHSLAGTHYTDLKLAAGLPDPGVDYYAYLSPGGVIPWSDGTLGDDQFVVYHPLDNTYWIAQAFSTSGSNLIAVTGGGSAGVGFGMVGGGTGGSVPSGFCGGGGRSAAVYTEIILISQVQLPTTVLAASSGSIAFGQSVVLSATTTSPSSSLFSQAIDSSADGLSWTFGSTVPGASWSGGPAAQNTLVWSYSPDSVGTWRFRAGGTDGVGLSNLPEVAVAVGKATPLGSFAAQVLEYGVPLAGLLTASFWNPYSSTAAQPTGAIAYSASGYGAVTADTVLPAGTYAITAAYPGDSNYNTAAAVATFQVNAAPPLLASIAASPLGGTAPLSVTVAWSTSGASSAVVAGTGVASTSLAGSQGVVLAAPGTYVYTITAGGPGGEVTRSASVSAGAAQVVLTTLAIGDGSVTPGGTYPAGSVVSVSATPGLNASFAGWTGTLTGVANPMEVTLNGDVTLYANFLASKAQTIAFSPPSTALFPGPGISLTATASSGLPTTLSLVSGPASLNGSELNFLGSGAVVVRASQGGNAQWLPAAPVTASIQVNPAAVIERFRFSATGNDARIASPNMPPGGAFIWTDSSGLQGSPWPSFDNPQPVEPLQQNTSLPSVPNALSP